MAIRGNGTMNNIDFRILKEDDSHLITLAVDWQSTKYGYPVDKKSTENKIKALISQEEYKNYVVGCFENNKLIGINTHVSWKSLPFWSFSGLIIKPDVVNQGIMSSKQISILSQMLEFNCSIGEKNLRFDWITVTQDSTHQLKTRHHKIMDTIYQRYTGVDLNIITPGESPQYHYLEHVLNSPHTKPLVVKMFSLKNELRSTNWINYVKVNDYKCNTLSE
jgi:hypothetical protein